MATTAPTSETLISWRQTGSACTRASSAGGGAQRRLQSGAGGKHRAERRIEHGVAFNEASDPRIEPACETHAASGFHWRRLGRSASSRTVSWQMSLPARIADPRHSAATAGSERTSSPRAGSLRVRDLDSGTDWQPCSSATASRPPPPARLL
jgi:hypothetical protein